MTPPRPGLRTTVFPDAEAAAAVVALERAAWLIELRARTREQSSQAAFDSWSGHAGRRAAQDHDEGQRAAALLAGELRAAADRVRVAIADAAALRARRREDHATALAAWRRLAGAS